MKVLLLDESTGAMYPWLASGICLIKICISLWQTYRGQCQHTLVLLSTDLQTSLLRWRAGILHLPDWAKLLGLYTWGTDSLPFYSPITHFNIEEIKHLWYQQPLFNCTCLLYNSISCSVFICIPPTEWEYEKMAAITSCIKVLFSLLFIKYLSASMLWPFPYSSAFIFMSLSVYCPLKILKKWHQWR